MTAPRDLEISPCGCRLDRAGSRFMSCPRHSARVLVSVAGGVHVDHVPACVVVEVHDYGQPDEKGRPLKYEVRHGERGRHEVSRP